MKSNLTKPEDNWPPATAREGLVARAYSESEAAKKVRRLGVNVKEEKWWTIEYSRKYRSVTKAFMQAVRAGGENKSCIYRYAYERWLL